MNNLATLFGLCFSPLLMAAQQPFSIHGKISKSNASSTVYLSYTKDGLKSLDSTQLKDGEFSFSGKLTSPVMATLSLGHNREAHEKVRDILGLYLEPANITIVGGDSLTRAKIFGSKMNDENKILTESLRPVNKELALLRAKYQDHNAGASDTTYQRVQKKIVQLTDEQNMIKENFIAMHRDSYVALFVFAARYTPYGFDPARAEREFAKFPPALRSSAMGRSISEQISGKRNAQVGKQAVDFVQNDINGKPVSLSSFRGKYVLVDFWASWCGPCRAENPNVLSAYQQLKRKNFDIIGVSLDEKDAEWKKAVEKDALPWIQLSDLKGWRNQAARLYGIQGIPQNLLIDPNGLIIAKDLRGKDLYKKLDALIK